MRSLLNPKIVVWPAAILVIHILATVLGWYDAILWFDTPMHFLGGIALALSAYYFLQQEKITLPRLVQVLFIVSTVALVAVLWEFMEFFADHSVGVMLHQTGLYDTLKDLFMGISGATITALIISLKK